MAYKKEMAPVIPSKEIFVGDEAAPVTLMEFGEYESDDCAKANEVVKDLLEKYEGKIKFNFRHFPLTKIHQRSLKAGEAAIAAAQSGKFLEILGTHTVKNDAVSFDKDRILHWIKMGAQVSDTAHNMLVKQGIIEGKKKNVLSKKSPTVKRKEAKK